MGQRPRLTGRNHLLNQLGKPSKKILPVFIIVENPYLFDSSDENMVQAPGACLRADTHRQASMRA